MNIGNHITRHRYSFEQSNDKTNIRLPMCKIIDKKYIYNVQATIRDMKPNLLQILGEKIRI